jgi:hypothetical protein
MQEVLVDGGELVLEDLVEDLDHCLIALHGLGPVLAVLARMTMNLGLEIVMKSYGLDQTQLLLQVVRMVLLGIFQLGFKHVASDIVLTLLARLNGSLEISRYAVLHL